MQDYTQQLEAKPVSIDRLYLDPNNPRFWAERNRRQVADKKVVEENVQAGARRSIAEHGLTELKNSILRNGFLPLDRIVVRPLDGVEGAFVAVEGNRRLAALKLLREEIADGVISEPEITSSDLESLLRSTDEIEVLIYRGDEPERAVWTLQGVRHLSGIRDWSAAQRGKLIADRVDGDNVGFRAVGQQLGLTPQQAGRYYRSFKALEQMKGNEEYADRARNDYFTLFEEAIRRKNVKNWLEWSDDTASFESSDNLEQFYDWICPDPEHEDIRRISNPGQMKSLDALLTGGHDDLLTKVDQHEVTLDEAYGRMAAASPNLDWSDAVDKIKKHLGELVKAGKDDPPNVLGGLDEIRTELDRVARMVNAADANNAA